MRSHFALEVMLLLRTRLFIVVVGVLIALAILSGFQGGQLARAQQDAIDVARTLEAAGDAEALANADRVRSGVVDPPWWQNPLNVQAWSYSLVRHAALPPKDLAGVAIADADMQPFLFRINPHPPDRWSNRTSELTPSLAAYGGFDLANVLLLLTPLLVVIAFADVIRDRNGSERQRLATVQAESEFRLLRYRLFPRAIVVLTLVLAAGLAGIVATRPPATAEAANGGSVILLVFAAHAVFWIVLAGVFVVIARAAVTTFACYIALWFVLGVLAPMIVDGVARTSNPPPTPLKVFANERSEIVRARMMEEDLTRAYAAEDPLAREMLLTALEEHQLLITPTNLLVQNEVDARRAEGRKNEHETRARFLEEARWLSSCSPLLLARQSIYAQAGRDQARRRAFNEQVNDYHVQLQQSFVPLLMRRATLDAVLLPEPFRFEEI